MIEGGALARLPPSFIPRTTEFEQALTALDSTAAEFGAKVYCMKRGEGATRNLGAGAEQSVPVFIRARLPGRRKEKYRYLGGSVLTSPASSVRVQRNFGASG